MSPQPASTSSREIVWPSVITVISAAILIGAEVNAEIEHASPYGKAPGQKNAEGKLVIGARADRQIQLEHVGVVGPRRSPAAGRSRSCSASTTPARTSCRRCCLRSA